MDERQGERIDNLTTLVALHAIPLLRHAEEQMRILVCLVRVGLVLSLVSFGLAGAILWLVVSST